MRQILLFAALAAVLALLLVSCGGTKDKPVPTEEDAPSKAAYHKISAEEACHILRRVRFCLGQRAAAQQRKRGGKCRKK